ncbi:hypothetical protein GF389_00175, partial [Candidatus Dojkabacteria bacterium]|nr:hypothetical protein [Candidatus Dojkabacteria bacterium]
MIDIVLTITILVFILGLLVFVHELGHFLAAKIIGAEVEEFAFGFGKTLFSKQLGDTSFKINLLPLGGYVKVLGDEDPSSFTQKQAKGFTDEEIREYNRQIKKLDFGKSSIIQMKQGVKDTKDLSKDQKLSLLRYINKYIIPNDPDNLNNKGFLARFFVYVAGVIMNLLLAGLIFTLYLSINDYKDNIIKIADYPFVLSDVQEVERPIVNYVYSDSLKANGFEINDDTVAILLLEIQGKRIKDKQHFNNIWKSIEGEEIEVKYQRVGDGKILTKNLILNSETIDVDIEPELQNKVIFSSILENKPAQEAGIKPKEILLEVNQNEVEFENSQEFIDLLEKNAGKNVVFTILDQEGKTREVEVALDQPQGDEPVLGASFVTNQPLLVRQYSLDYSKNKIGSGMSHAINM